MMAPTCWGREAAEIIEVHQVPFPRAIEMAHSGEMVDGHSTLALLRSEPYLRSRFKKAE